MKRTVAILLALLLALGCAGCRTAEPAPADQPEPAPAVDTTEPDELAQPEPAPADNEPEPDPTENEPEPASDPADAPTVVKSQDCFDGAYCFRPEADGIYQFEAATSEDFYGWENGYESGYITWSVYVLDEAFDDAWRFLGQAYEPAIYQLDGIMRVELKAGQYVYCVCGYNGFTADAPAAEDAGTLTIARTDTPILPSAENGYVMPVSIGAAAVADLDGDGTDEVIRYSVNSAYVVDDVWYESQPSLLTVNGTELLDLNGDNPMEPFDIWIENPAVGKYYILDLDPSDGKLELALCDWGSNDWLYTHLFHYEDGKLVNIGGFSQFPDSEGTELHGDGTVSTRTQFDVMMTWGGIVTFALQDGQVAQVKGEFVEPHLYGELEITLRTPLTVYTSPDRSADTLTLEPSDQPVTFPLTDTEHWVLVRTADGTEGWAYFEGFWMVENNGEIVEDTEVFDGLLFAG